MLGDLAWRVALLGSVAFGGDDIAQFGHADVGEVVARSELPFVVGFDHDDGGQPEKRRRVGEDLHDISAALDFLVQSLDRIVRPNLLPVRLRECGEGQASGLASATIAATLVNDDDSRVSATRPHCTATSVGSVWAKIVLTAAVTTDACSVAMLIR